MKSAMRSQIDGNIRYRIPEIKIITPLRYHRLAEQVARDNERYIRRELAVLYQGGEEFENFVNEDHAGFVTSCFPTAKDDWIGLIAEWTSCWLAYDDIFSHGSKAGASPGTMRQMGCSQDTDRGRHQQS